jgi:hypothetical protein
MESQGKNANAGTPTQPYMISSCSTTSGKQFLSAEPIVILVEGIEQQILLLFYMMHVSVNYRVRFALREQ